MMLYKGVCGVEPKDASYKTAGGLDVALRPWRADSDMAKWFLSRECQNAYKPT